jgi:uncharacterized membrane protein
MAAEPKVRADIEESRAETETGVQTETGTGLDQNIAGALSYLFSPLTGILFFVVDGKNEFVRFHAAQSIVFGVGMFALYVGLTFVQFALLLVPRLGGLLSLMFSLVYLVVGFGAFLAWAFLMYKAYSGETYRMPVFGKMADRLA